MSDYTIHTGDVLDVLPTLESGSINTCVTSPPYFGLRDYGHDGQIGLEPTPDAYVAKLVAVFREVKRVLRDDGTVWLNLGDSYASFRDGKATPDTTRNGDTGTLVPKGAAKNRIAATFANTAVKHKDLVGIPWRVAFALQADGWYLRQDIIWHKPNPMPESVRDRCTKAHEYIFLLSKSAQYYYDQDAVKEPISESTANDSRLQDDNYETGRPERGFTGSPSRGSGLLKPKGIRVGGDKYGDDDTTFTRTKSGNDYQLAITRNRRSVWSVTTKPFKEAHFAVFPPDLIRPCILAGCPEGGTVLDPFNGSGTTGVVCMEENRNYVGIELNPEYVTMAKRRISQAQPQWFGELV